MNEHRLHLLPEYFELVASGVKAVEVRVATPAKAAIRPGDTITFHSDHGRRVECEVTRVDRYPDFAALLAHEDPATITPATADPDAVLAALRGIYPPEKEQLGALALGITLLPDGRST
ncbi:ASCH domain-containing protein [Kitasatospora misakiensis]|uniref:ASCH domain-containing protein n=1 Tax=Kitasatospora misakiensis TaxID=67330 RepID=A0ABW0XC26_9ACTN